MNERERTCACGCGQVVSPGCRFRHGHWARTRGKRALTETFWPKVDRRGDDECWPWTAYVRPDGYGMVWDPDEGRMVNAHRVAYQLGVGPIPEAKPHVCHRCDNPVCCNPAHLFPGTSAENTADMVAKGRQADNTGERNPKAKLTEADVAEIRASATGRYGERMEIARRWGISSGHVSKILKGDVWTR